MASTTATAYPSTCRQAARPRPRCVGARTPKPREQLRVLPGCRPTEGTAELHLAAMLRLPVGPWLSGFGRILAGHVDRCLALLGAAVGSGVVRGVERPVLAGGARAPRGSIVRPGGGYHRDGELVARRAGCADHWSPRRDGQLVGGRGRVVGGPTGDRTRGRGPGMDHPRAGVRYLRPDPVSTSWAVGVAETLDWVMGPADTRCRPWICRAAARTGSCARSRSSIRWPEPAAPAAGDRRNGSRRTATPISPSRAAAGWPG